MQTREALSDLRTTARTPFAWPGGYRVHALLTDGETLCNDCIRSEYRAVYRATRDLDGSGWGFVDHFVNWEGAPVVCVHCGTSYPSEYGPFDESA